MGTEEPMQIDQRRIQWGEEKPSLYICTYKALLLIGVRSRDALARDAGWPSESGGGVSKRMAGVWTVDSGQWTHKMVLNFCDAQACTRFLILRLMLCVGGITVVLVGVIHLMRPSVLASLFEYGMYVTLF